MLMVLGSLDCKCVPMIIEGVTSGSDQNFQRSNQQKIRVQNYALSCGQCLIQVLGQFYIFHLGDITAVNGLNGRGRKS